MESTCPVCGAVGSENCTCEPQTSPRAKRDWSEQGLPAEETPQPPNRSSGPNRSEMSEELTMAAVLAAVPIGIIAIYLFNNGSGVKMSAAIAFALVGGPAAIAMAILNWDWAFECPPANRIVDTFGRNGARLSYLCLGAFLFTLSVFMLRGEGYLNWLF